MDKQALQEEPEKESQDEEASAPIDELQKCQKEKDEYLDGWKRAKADLSNYKKDEAKRFEQILKFANEGLIRELIAVLDSFDLGLVSLEREGEAPKGIYMIRAQLEDVLKQVGLAKIVVSIGQQFDPVYHEAIVSVESDKPSGIILEEVEKGYLLNGKLIRPARVKVAK